MKTVCQILFDDQGINRGIKNDFPWVAKGNTTPRPQEQFNTIADTLEIITEIAQVILRTLFLLAQLLRAAILVELQ